MKRYFLTYLIFCSMGLNLANPLHAAPLEIDRFFASTSEENGEGGRSPSFLRLLGFSKTELLEFLDGHLSPSESLIANKDAEELRLYAESSLIIRNKYEEYTIFSQDRKYKLQFLGIYEVTNDQVLGHCFVDTLHTQFDGKPVTPFPEVVKIKQLNRNPNYLSKELKRFPGTTLQFYEKKEGRFTERYGFLQFKNFEFLILDAYLSEDAEKRVKSRIIHAMNNQIEYLIHTYLQE